MKTISHLPLKIFLTVALVYVLVFACQQQTDRPVSEQATRAALTSYIEIFNTNNVDMIEAVIDSGFVCYHPAYPDNIVGLDGFRDWLEQNHSAFSDLQLIEDETVIKGDRAFVRWTFAGTHTGSLPDIPATGKTVRLDGLSFIRVANGKIVEERLGMDQWSAYRQFGFTLVPPSN